MSDPRPPFRPRALGEIAIRCTDRARMARFYEDVIGLTRLAGADGDPIIFLKVGEGFGGHTAVVALFAHQHWRPEAHPAPQGVPHTGALSSLHHIALSLPYAEQEAVIGWYERLGQPHRVEHFGWIGWRGVFTEDPEGNTVELVAYDPSELAAPA